MKIIFFGDIVGEPGRNAVKKTLSKWKKEYKPDLVIANGENIAHGKGITKRTVKELLESGIDLITLGDHTWSQNQAFELLQDKKLPVIRPANFSPDLPGQGYCFLKVKNKKVLVINLIGRVFMHQEYDDPFRMASKIIEKEKADLIIIDFHAEATAEKICLGWYLDGKITALLGTHTHIPTADERVLPKGTGYITDVGMVGVRDSSLGRDKEDALERFLTQTKVKMKVPQGPVEVNGVLIKTEKNKTKTIQRIKEIVK